ncbi:hypothetical protein [Ferribacterium limneticum]|uniref:hypothetical protein n=1 Tax=Ferribacterium limneticum TaxID=76259 RepID=UPI001CF8D180|nr:hypothetical protein [Ferribacterium limneticum]UCV26716.1 hypothetical protein KI617_10385 [Ferribacterium limneticum]UCV30633.1 hypothetical protein KI608_10385 [Ferribacterium limneticum]
MNDIVAPPNLAETPLESWREWFNEICADYLYASSTDIRAITTDIAGRAQLNRKQRAWLLPLPQAVTAQGASILLAFCLYGAVRAGAQVQILTKDSFVVEKDGSSWGVRAYSPAPGEIGPLFNYLHYLQGNVRWGSTCRNGNLVRAFKEARKQGNKEAMHILQACYWNTPDTWAMDSLFTTGT